MAIVPPRTKLTLDTSAYAQLRRDHEVVIDLVAAAQLVCVPTIVIGELEAGFELGQRKDENRVMLGEFLSEPWVSVVTVTREIARHYGELFASLRRSGTPVPVNDIWIAACALEEAATLVSFDRDFERFDRLNPIILVP